MGGRAEPTMNYWSPWGAEQVKEKIDFHFFKIVLNHKLKFINFTDLSPSPILKIIFGKTFFAVNDGKLQSFSLIKKDLYCIHLQDVLKQICFLKT